jgi:hypothetical protein
VELAKNLGSKAGLINTDEGLGTEVASKRELDSVIAHYKQLIGKKYMSLKLESVQRFQENRRNGYLYRI